MKSGLRFALLLPVAALLACGVTPTTSTTAVVGNWQNWQIQAGTAIASPPNTYPSFVGAIQIQGTQASGIFTTVYSPGTPTPSSTVEDFAGTFNPSNQALSLITNGYSFAFTEPSTPYTPVPFGVIGGCVGNPPPACLAISLTPSVAVQIAPLNGTYAGTLTASNDPSLSGTATLTLTQSSTPNASGAFPLTGTMTLPASGFPSAYPIAGTVSGEGIVLSPVTAPGFYIGASTNPAGTQITVSSLVYGGGGVDPLASFTGTLTLQ
jgi:hypothetical protein